MRNKHNITQKYSNSSKHLLDIKIIIIIFFIY